jgi:cell wall-associated NlpC family hydrolase
VTRNRTPHWSGRYVGLPWQDGGRDGGGVDCWGLVRLVYSFELGIDLPTYGEIPARSLIAVARAVSAGKDGEDWRAVENGLQTAFDVCVMRLSGRGATGHVGVMIDTRNVLHVEAACDAAIVPLDHFTIRERIACFRRHRLGPTG